MNAVGRAPRVALVVSHPIQHFTPFYRELAEGGADLHVLFMSGDGLVPYFDPGFGREVQWGEAAVEGFRYEVVFDHQAGTMWQRPWMAGTAIWRQLDRVRPDCVLVHGYAHSFALSALAWCRTRSVPSLLFGDSELLGSRARRVRVTKRLLLPPLFRHVSGFLTIGDNNEDYLVHYGVSRQKMFRMPIPTDERMLHTALLKRTDHRAAVRSELGLASDAVLGLFVGKLVPRKRPIDLVAAVRAVTGSASEGPPLAVLFAGDGQLRAQLDEAAAGLHGAVRLLGFTDPERLAELYAAVDFYVHPSERDPHPLAIKEAVLCGLPVVTTDQVGSVGMTDDVRPGRNGRVYRTGDTAELAAVVDDLRRHPERRAAMAAESEKIATEIDVQAAVRGFQRALAAVTS